MVGKGVPQSGGCRPDHPRCRAWFWGLWRVFALADRRVREEVWGMRSSLRYWGGLSVDALVSELDDLVLDSEWDREPVEGFENGGDVIVFAHPHQNPGSAVLDVLQLQKICKKSLCLCCVGCACSKSGFNIQRIMCFVSVSLTRYFHLVWESETGTPNRKSFCVTIGPKNPGRAKMEKVFT